MKQTLIKISLWLAIFTSLVFVPQVLMAQTTNPSNECSQLLQQIEKFGKDTPVTDLPKYCDPVSVYSKITGFMYYIIGIVAVISLIYAGYLYMTARDNEAQLKKAKFTMIWTIVGIVVAVLATLIVGAVINLIVDNKIF